MMTMIKVYFVLLLFVSEQVGRLKCPLLLVLGDDDQNWPAQESALDVSLLTRQHPVWLTPSVAGLN